MAEAGPTADLLDTQATIYLKAGQAEPARNALLRAIAQRPWAGAYFHLAQAELLARNKSAARKAFRKATSLGLKRDALHALEWPALAKLAGDLGP
jgi:hypothetical protein